MKKPRNNRQHLTGKRKHCKVRRRTSSDAEVRVFPLLVFLFAIWSGLLPRHAVAQIVRGTLIDAPTPVFVPATNRPPLSQTLTNAPSAGRAEVPKGFHRMPFDPAGQTDSSSNNEQAVKSALPGRAETSGTLPEMRGGYLAAGFDKLSAFPASVVLESAGPKMVGQIPDAIKSLDGKSVFIKGFMMPMNYQSGFTTNCVLLRNRSMCCYGIPPRINEWVLVRMVGKSIEVILDRPVTIFGKLHVGEYRENGRLLRSIYVMDGEKMERPDDSR